MCPSHKLLKATGELCTVPAHRVMGALCTPGALDMPGGLLLAGDALLRRLTSHGVDQVSPPESNKLVKGGKATALSGACMRACMPG